MPQSNSLGVGLIGAGFMGGIHAEALARDARAELLWVVDPSTKKARGVARKFAKLRGRRRLCHVTDSITEMLADEKVDTVYIATQPRSHAKLANQSLRAGRHVFVEKPATFTVAEGEQLLRTHRSCKRQLYVGHVCRFFPEYEQIRKRVLAGDVGQPAMVRASRCMGNPGGWYEDKQRSLGVPGDLLLHDFDLVLWMFGPANRVFGFSSARRPPIGEQHFLASIHHKNGVLTHLQGSWAHVDSFRTRFEVSGSDGVIEFDSSRRAPLLTKKARKGRATSALVVPESPATMSPYDRQTSHFLDVLQGRCKPRIQAKEAVLALDTALAAARSARKKQPQSPNALLANKGRRS